MTELNKLYQQAIDKWGKASQMVMALEETTELQKEVCKILRGDYSEVRKNYLADEIADVRLMLNQLEYMFSLHEKVAGYTRSKITRLESLLSDSSKGN